MENIDIKKNIAVNIAKYRKERNMTQKELAARLGVIPSRVSNWENGTNSMDINTLFEICSILSVSINDMYGVYPEANLSLSYDEQLHIKKYRSLDSYGKDMVDTVLDKEYARSSEQTAAGCGLCETPAVYHLPYYHSLASAGSGEYIFDDIPADIISVPDTPVAHSADFVIGVNGHSMEPEYMDGDKVYVRKASEISAGRIGIFVRGNDCYIKEYASDRLISLNHDYPDIPASDDISLVGEVIGKV